MGYPDYWSLEDAVNKLSEVAHRAARAAGWWGQENDIDKVDVPRCLCLIHSEISEAMEGHRKDLMDDHLPNRKMIEVELADALIRIGDLAGALGLDLGGAVSEKMAYNAKRKDHKISARNEPGGKQY